MNARQRVRHFILILVIVTTAIGLASRLTSPRRISAQTAQNWPVVGLVAVASGLTQPVDIESAADGSNRLFIAERTGRIRIIENGIQLPDSFLDLSDRILISPDASEQGLLGIAFPPNFANKGYFYVNYTRPVAAETNGPGQTIIERYWISSNPNIADRDNRQTILVLDQPYINHNGGQISFGPDGYLYIAMGDGGSGGDPVNRAQDLSSKLGKMLRIDVESTPTSPGYLIPISNPTLGGNKSEIWAYGLRNPWRFAFDRTTDDLYIADVGQNAWEEVNLQSGSSTGGENYGWRIMEATHCYNSVSCSSSGLVQPIAEYSHSVGCSVTGEKIYRGSTYPRMQGVYFYGDFCTGIVSGLRRVNSVWQQTTLLDAPFHISTFGEDEDGEIYVADFAGGVIYNIRDTSGVPLYRLSNIYIGDHFYTASAAERESARSSYGYVYEGVCCLILPTQVGISTPLFRLSSAQAGDHFYTTDASERDLAQSNYGYVYEGIVGYCFPQSAGQFAVQPLYRLNSPSAGDHFYTTSLTERNAAIQSYGYLDEGIACYVPAE